MSASRAAYKTLAMGVYRRFFAKDISSVVKIYVFLGLLIFQFIAVVSV